jgi:hypothetical protein
LRIFPPSEINYPDIKYDEDFFEKIGCPRLRVKFPTKEEKKFLDLDRVSMKLALSVADDKTKYLYELMKEYKYPTTRRLYWDILNKI